MRLQDFTSVPVVRVSRVTVKPSLWVPPMEPGRSGIESFYQQLGIQEDASFDAVQRAKTRKLAACGDDSQAKAQVEAAYDAVLMDRLKRRQAGHLSSEAASASEQEARATTLLRFPALPRLPRLLMPPGDLSADELKTRIGWPVFSLAEGQQLWLPLCVYSGLLAWVFVFPITTEALSLSLSIGASTMIVTLLWRGSGFMRSVLWGLAGLVVGILFGFLVTQPLVSGDPLQDLRMSSAIALVIQLVLAITLL